MDDLQTEALDVYSRVNELSIEADDLEAELQKDPRYLRMQAARLEAENLMEDFKERALTTLQIRGEKTSVGDFGKITVVSRETFKVSDEKLVPEKYFAKTVDLKLVKKDMTLLGKSVPGIEYKNTQTIRITPKTSKESS